MRLRVPKIKKSVWIGTIVLVVIAGFQNCSNVNFQQAIDNTHTYSLGFTSAAMKIEGGRFATNKHLLSITVVGLNPNTMDQMRIANKKDMVGNTFPASAVWQPFAQQFQFELSDDFASDGSKDNQKTLVMEVKPKLTADIQTVAPFSSQILLDTVPPSLIIGGVMKFGLNGATYAKGQSMALDWTAAEVIAPTGSSSGLDPNASIQVGWSDPEDCSKFDQTKLGPLQPDNAATRQFVWPKDSRLESFYICIFAEDRAGNRTTGLSQPMTDIWQVIAGDNNQGNGGSWKAANVRFSFPNTLAVDSKDNLYIYDNDFVNIRKVAADGTISSYLGNGQIGTAPITDQYNMGLPIYTIGMAFDSKDRLYYGEGDIYRYTVNETTHAVQTEQLLQGGINFAVHKFTDGIEYLVFSTLHSNNNGVLDYSYIYKVPLSKFDGVTTPFTEDGLASYRIAGSGNLNDFNAAYLPRQQAAATALMPCIRSIQVDSNDDIYFGGSTDGSGYDMGEHALFLLRAGQVYKLTSENVGPYWTTQLEIITRADGTRYAVAGGHYGLVAVQLNLSVLPVTADLPTQLLSPVSNPSSGANDMAYGVAQLHQRIGNEPLYFGLDQTTSKVFKYQSLSRIDSFGRNVYNPADTDALTSMVNVPSGIAEDPSGNIYYFEALSDIIRKLDPTSHLSVFSGTPFTSSAPASQVGKSSSAALLAGESYGSGYMFPMVYDDANARLIMGFGSTGEILNLPISPAQTVTRMSLPMINATSMTASDFSGLDESPDKNAWPIMDLHLNGSQLIAERALTVVPYRVQIMSYSGGGAQPLIGNELTQISLRPVGGSTSVYTGAATSVALSYYQPMAIFGGVPYLSNQGGILADNGGTVAQVSTIASSFTNFDMTSDSAGRKFLIGTQSNNVKAAVLYPDGTSKAYTLCMPGSFTNAQFVRISRDGNSLLISDTGQRRIVRYWLRVNGVVTLFAKPTSGTACVPITI